MTQINNWEKEFEDKFVTIDPYFGYTKQLIRIFINQKTMDSPILDKEEDVVRLLKQFIKEQIVLAKAEERKRVVEELLK